MVIVVDDENRENEGDFVIAAEKVTPEAINFMAKHGRGLICLPTTPERLDELRIPAMVSHSTAAHGTDFAVSVGAKHKITTGISAYDRAATVRAIVDPGTRPEDISMPGHVFPLRARRGGVLERAGHTEAAVDLARLAGLFPAGVICEIMNEDGTMARMPDLVAFAQLHGLKIGTIADLIAFRSHNESLIERMGRRVLVTPWGPFDCTVFKDRTGGVHLALTIGQWSGADEVLVRVHEPLSLMDVLDAGSSPHSWPLPEALRALQAEGRGVAVLLNAGDDADALLARALPASTVPAPRGQMDLRTYGVGAQILRQLGVVRMRLLGHPRRMPSMTGYGLEVTGFVAGPAAALQRAAA